MNQEGAFHTVENLPKTHLKALLLNASYEPIKLVTWQKALVLFYQQKVEVVDKYDIYVNSSFNKHQVPCVIRLKAFVKRRHKLAPTFNRHNVFRRDSHNCQYCHKKFAEKELTLDHVIPASRGGKKTWENIVTSCRSCNQKKANKTPKEANMCLLKRPVAPQWRPEIYYEKFKVYYPESWRLYLV